MLTKLVWNQICVTPIVFTLTLSTAFSVRASEVPEPSEPPATIDAAMNAAQLSSVPIEVSLPNAEDLTPTENAVATSTSVFQPWTDDITGNEWYVSDTVILEMSGIEDDRVEDFQAQSIQFSNLSNQISLVEPPALAPAAEIAEVIDDEAGDAQFTGQTSEINLEVAENLIEDNLSNATAIDLIPLSQTEIVQVLDATWYVAQVPVEPEAEQSKPEPTREATADSPSPRWRFTFQPYGFVPFSVDGSLTVRDFTSEIDLGLDDILSSLSFAAAGRFEAWRGNLGFVFDAAYFSAQQDSSTSRSVSDCLDCVFPSEINTETKVQYGQFDLGVGYRFAAINPSEAVTEFDLGPIAFDAIVGMRVYAIRGEINISTNLDTSRELERSKTIFEPLVSGRIRWNLSPTLAGWVRGDIAGFGIQGMTFSAAFTGALEWMFSGNTSLLLGYRISSIEYTSDQDLELDLLLHGPYLGAVFRF